MGYFDRPLRSDLASARAVEVALGMAALGVPVMPVSPAKVPILKDWPEVASTDPAQIARWEARPPGGWNWAGVTGRRAGVFVLDVDGARGRQSLAELEAHLGPLPTTPAVTSGRDDGGLHLWFALPADQMEPRTCSSVLAPGLDLRGRGGQVVLPGSRHRSGRRYVWTVSPASTPFASIPATWIAVLPVAGARGGRGRAPLGVRGARRDPIVFGDGDDGQGFDGPIWRTCCAYFSADVDAPVEPLLDKLIEIIATAPCAPERENLSRYLDPTFLMIQADKALEWATSLSDHDEELDTLRGDLAAALHKDN